MAMNKRAIFFTIIALVFLTLLFFSMNVEKSYTLRERSAVIGERIKSVDHFIDDVEKDIQRGTYIASFRSLLGIQQYITSKGTFLNDTQASFREILINGTINGEYMSVMNETQLSIWIEKIQHEAGKVAIELSYRINSVRLYQETPWMVGIDLNVTLNISDMRNTASWTRNQVITTDLNISTFEDPLYTVYSYGRVINTIEESNITDFTNNSNTSNLLYHLDHSLYIESNSSPSYVMRLSGNLSASDRGIESLVNLKKFEDMLLDVKEKSCVDYIYFSEDDPTNWLINNTYNWFRLDNQSNHLAVYEVQNLTI